MRSIYGEDGAAFLGDWTDALRCLHTPFGKALFGMRQAKE